MASGGARNRSGPGKSENSARSDRVGYSLTALPASYVGEIPDFPLSDASQREIDLWTEKWRGPHGAAWSQPSERWRWWDVAIWVRTAVRCEDPGASASLLNGLPRLGDRAGLSTAGLAEMGWKVAVDETATKRAEKAETTTKQKSSRDRLTIASSNGG